MEHALPRRTAGIPRTWSLCMTSENHGTVGPAGCTFSHAPEKHERVLVVEVPAAADAPVDQVNLQLVGARRRRAVAEFKGYVDGQPAVTWLDRDNMPRVGTKLFAGPFESPSEPVGDGIDTPEFRERLRGLGATFSAHGDAYKLLVGYVNRRNSVAAQAAHVAPAEELARFCPACGSVGDVGPAYRDCCPDGNEARPIPKRLAAKCHELFKVALSTMRAAAPASPAQAEPLPAASVSAPAPAELIECWSHNEEDFNAQSLGELIDTHELQPGATVWVGEAVHPEPASLFSTDWLIENMGEAAYDIAGEHGGEDYPNVSDEQVAELEALVVGWITKCAPPTFWTVKNVWPYVLTAEDCGDQASTSGERQEGGAA